MEGIVREKTMAAAVLFRPERKIGLNCPIGFITLSTRGLSEITLSHIRFSKRRLAVKKFIAITRLSISAMLLSLIAGCSSNISSEANSSNQNSSSNTSNVISDPVSDNSGENSSNSEISEPESSNNSGSSLSNESELVIGNEITAQFELPGGESVDLTNAVVTGPRGNIPLSEMTADNWNYVMCDYVYLAEPLGIYYDSVVNADIFDKNKLTFAGAPKTAVFEYKKYKVGDMFGDLKLVEASTSFCPDWSYLSPRFFNGGTARFEGRLTLTGICCIAPETEGYTHERDIHFYPDAQGAKLPIMNYSLSENGCVALSMGMNGDFCWLSEYFRIVLGNADGYPDFDFGGFPDDGSFVNVQVTVDNINFRNELNFGMIFRANLVDLKVIQ